MRDESYVSVKEEVVENPTSLNVSDAIQIGGVIIAPTGPSVALITSPSELLKYYTLNGSVPRNADQSFLNAYYLLQSTPMVLARAMNTQLRGGVSIIAKTKEVGNLTSIDGNAEAVEGLLFDDKNDLINWKLSGLEFEFPNENNSWKPWIWVVNDLLMYYGDVPDIIDVDSYTLTQIDDVTDVVEALSTLGDVYFTNIIKTKGNCENDKPQKISFDVLLKDKDGLNYSEISADTSKIPSLTEAGRGTASIVLNFSEVIEGNVWKDFFFELERTIIYFGNKQPTVPGFSKFQKVNNATEILDLFNNIAHIGVTSPQTVELYPSNIEIKFNFTEDTPLTYSQVQAGSGNKNFKLTEEQIFPLDSEIGLTTGSFTIDIPRSGLTWQPFYFLVGNSCIYFGESIPKINGYDKVKIEANKESLLQAIQNANSNINILNPETIDINQSPVTVNFSIVKSAGRIGYTTVSTNFDITSSDDLQWRYINSSTGNGPQKIKEFDSTKQVLFSIVSNYVSNQDSYTLSLRGLSGNKSRLRIVDSPANSDEENQTFDFSLKGDQKDSTGQNMYIDNLGDLDLGFTIINSEDINVAGTVNVDGNFYVGNSQVYNSKASKTLTHVTEAITVLEQQELYDIDGLCLLGLQESDEGSQIARLFAIEGPKHKWFCPIGVPRAYTNRRTIFNWANSLSLPEPNPVPGVIMMGPFDKNTAMVSFPCYIDPGCKYWERVVTNKSLKKEFAPVFKDDVGVMNMSRPCLELQKVDRNILLNRSKAVNWICLNKRTGVYYLNQNWSWQQKQGIVTEEENIVRQMWKISRDLNPILEQFFAKFNNRSTRQTAIDLVDNYMQWNIMNQEYPPVEYRVICDSSNNDDAVIRAHKINFLMQVRYQGSIKWANVINRAYPLGVDFTDEM